MAGPVTPPDRSVYALLAANLFALGIAVYFNLSLRHLVIAYWFQSMIIGVSFFIRILCLKQYSSVEYAPDGTSTEIRNQGKTSAALGMLAIFTLLHLFYAVFLVGGDQRVTQGARLAIAGCVLVFFVCHAWSLARNIRLDGQDDLRLQTVATLPFFRVLPMHLMAFGGVVFLADGANTAFVVIFALLKTGADVVMHLIEHHELRMGSSLRWLRDAHFDRERALDELRGRDRG